MKHIFLSFITFFLFTLPQTVLPSTPSKQDIELISKANKRIKALNKSSIPTKHSIKVVYFHASDQAPLKGWQERLPRTLADVSTYYKEAFSRFGLKSKGLPFEKVKGEIFIQSIQGDSVSNLYNISSFDSILREIERKANGRIHFSTDYVLIINGLCDYGKDSIYYFHSPYGAIGSTKSGVCFVADCEQLDTRLLKDTVQKMTFTEMAVKDKTCSVAEFNSWYIGGIAHEMGHIFGLPHDFGGQFEFPESETSLMGEFGSRHFRDYLWKGEKTSYFSTASIFQLMSHPVFAGSPNINDQLMDFDLTSVKINPTDSSLSVECSFEGSDRPYGVVALFRPIQLSEYRNCSYSAVLNETNSVKLKLSKVPAGNYPLRFLFLFPNGSVSEFNRLITTDSTGIFKVVEVATLSQVDKAAFLAKLIKSQTSPDVDTKIDILKGLLFPPTPFDLKTFEGNQLYLSDAQWEKANVGWGKVARNYFSNDMEATFFLELHGKLYKKGLYAHSTSTYIFNTDQKWKTFTATIGLRDYAHTEGSARFTVIGDGKILYQSGAIRVNMSEDIHVDISGVKKLKLLTEGTEGHNHNSWAIWVNPLVEK